MTTGIVDRVSMKQVQEVIRIYSDAIRKIDAMDEEIAVKCKQHIINADEYTILHFKNIEAVKSYKAQMSGWMDALNWMKITKVEFINIKRSE